MTDARLGLLALLIPSPFSLEIFSGNGPSSAGRYDRSCILSYARFFRQRTTGPQNFHTTTNTAIRTATDITAATAMPAFEISELEVLLDLVGEASAPLTGLVGAGVDADEVVLEDVELKLVLELEIEVEVEGAEDVDSVVEDGSVELVVDVGGAIVTSDVVELSGVAVGVIVPSSVVVAAGMKILERKLPNGSRSSCRSCRGAA